VLNSSHYSYAWGGHTRLNSLRWGGLPFYSVDLLVWLVRSYDAACSWNTTQKTKSWPTRTPQKKIFGRGCSSCCNGDTLRVIENVPMYCHLLFQCSILLSGSRKDLHVFGFFWFYSVDLLVWLVRSYDAACSMVPCIHMQF
jgi:hypothetical protein